MPKTIDTASLQRLRKGREGFLLVDVADAVAFAKDHIPGACNVPFAAVGFVQAIAARLAGSKGRKVVVYGEGPPSLASGQACEQLLADGFTNVHDYAGGLAAWNESRLKDGRPTRTP